MALINGTKNILFSDTKKSFTDIFNDAPNPWLNTPCESSAIFSFIL